MSERLERISRLKADRGSRESYIKSKLGVLVPSQIRALRLRSKTPTQKDLAKASKMYQSRLSKLETPGAANVTIETLAEIAAFHKVGLIVKFASFSEMVAWENGYSQDAFSVTPIDSDVSFLEPNAVCYLPQRSNSLKDIEPKMEWKTEIRQDDNLTLSAITTN